MAKPTTRTEKYFLTFEGITPQNLSAFVDYFIDNEAIQEQIQIAIDNFVENEND